MPSGWEQARRILVMRLDNIGDVVMTGPALRTLRTAMPQARITLMASPAGSQIAPLLPWVDEVLVERVVWQDASWSLPLDPDREMALVERLRVHSFDAAVILTSFSQSPYPPAYACYLAGIPIRLGQSKEFGGSLLSQWVGAPPDDLHQVDRNLFLLEAAGFEPAGRQLELVVPEPIQAQADRLLAAGGIAPDEPFIVLAPGASAAARRYDPGRFAEVARRLAGMTGLPLVVIGSAREADMVEQVLDGLHGCRHLALAGRTSVPEMAAVIRRAGLMIANNSGPMHIADAFARPMVILFAGTDLEGQWQPRTSPRRLLRRATACSPCHLFQCRYNLECLDIQSTEVVEAALSLLDQAATVASALVTSEVATRSRQPCDTSHQAAITVSDGAQPQCRGT